MKLSEYKCPLTGNNLYYVNKSILYNPMTKRYFILTKEGSLINAKDSDCGGTLSPQLEPPTILDNLLNRLSTTNNPLLYKLISKLAKDEQTPKTFISDYTGETFTWDETRKAFIPNYVPDDELYEKGHIEGDYLVGNTTGKRYKISPRGEILTPSVIERNAKNEILYKKLLERTEAKKEKMKLEGDLETQSEVQKKDLEVWKINHNLKDLDSKSNIPISEYLEYTLQMLENYNNKFLIELTIKNNICYYCAYNINNRQTIQARTFPYNEDFLRTFLKPLLAYQVKNNTPPDIRITPNQTNQNISNFYLVNFQNIISIHNIDTEYAYAITNEINKYLEENKAKPHQK